MNCLQRPGCAIACIIKSEILVERRRTADKIIGERSSLILGLDAHFDKQIRPGYPPAGCSLSVSTKTRIGYF